MKATPHTRNISLTKSIPRKLNEKKRSFAFLYRLQILRQLLDILVLIVFLAQLVFLALLVILGLLGGLTLFLLHLRLILSALFTHR